MQKTEFPSWIELGIHYGLIEDLSEFSSIWLSKKARKLVYDTVRNRLFDEVWDEMKASGEERPPFLQEPTKGRINDFARTRKITRIVFVDMIERAMIRRTGEGFEIFLSNKLDPLSLRSALAHEIGHTYFYPIHHNYACCEPVLDTQSAPDWKRVEGPVYEVARQIIIPQQCLVAETIGLPVSIPKFHTLRRLFDATRDFLAARLVRDLQIWDVYITWFRISVGNLTYHDSLEKSMYYRLAENVGQTYRGPSFRHLKRKEFADLVSPVLNEHLTNLLRDSAERKASMSFAKPILSKVHGKERKYLVEVEFVPSNSMLTLMLKKAKE